MVAGSDEMDRDIALLATKNPRIDTTAVSKRLLVFAGEAITQE